MAIAHHQIEAREHVEHVVAQTADRHVWERPGGAASIGFHLRHLGGALDRLFTYARGEMLSAEQRAAFKVEEARRRSTRLTPRYRSGRRRADRARLRTTARHLAGGSDHGSARGTRRLALDRRGSAVPRS